MDAFNKFVVSKSKLEQNIAQTRAPILHTVNKDKQIKSKSL